MTEITRRPRLATVVGMTPQEIEDLVRLRRARDRMDRDYAQPLDVEALARGATCRPGTSAASSAGLRRVAVLRTS